MPELSKTYQESETSGKLPPFSWRTRQFVLVKFHWAPMRLEIAFQACLAKEFLRSSNLAGGGKGNSGL